MRVVWISNRRLDVDKRGGYGGGWLTSLMNNLTCKPDVELFIFYTDHSLKAIRKECVNKVWHYGFPRRKNVLKYDLGIEKAFGEAIDEIQPDIIHAQGTENANAIAAMRSRPDYTYVVSIQGLIGRYAEHYVAGVPVPYSFDLTIRDFFHKDGPISKGKKFAKASWYENEMIEKADYVMARTSWDVACVRHLNRKCPIYSDLRVLRASFYENEWSLNNCNRNSIFVGSSQNQIKGLHYVIQALPLIKKVFPDTHLYISSPDFTQIKTFKDLCLYQTYYIYINSLITKYKLRDSITFMGVLTEKEMCNAFRKAHVFILPSIIENSPNTLSEAAVLGVPTVASYIAGVPDLIENDKNGFLYAYDEYYIMADRVIKLFSDDELALRFSTNLKEKARKMYDAKKNTNLVYNAYVDIINKKAVG